ncbi:MAG TPA: 2-oxoglutarate dehydrogenase E1 component, partial [Bacteroidia bacterium]|nr:2-oxoglutarate dehydrogenase E1 component [Bacteroidia bacterium]
MSHTISSRANVDLIDQKYAEWKSDPLSVDQNWAMFFEGFELGMAQPAPPASGGATRAADEGGLDLQTRARVVSLVGTYRSLGHTAAWLDPLEAVPPSQPLLSLGHLGFDVSHLDEEVSTQFYEN